MNDQISTRPIPKVDLRASDDLQNEWWYYHGHLENGSRRFGFHLVFFRRQSGKLKFAGIFPVSRISKQLRFAHLSLTDIHRRTFFYGHRRAVFGDGGADNHQYRVWIGDWSVAGNDDIHLLRANIRGVRIELQLESQKPPVAHGDAGLIETPGGRSHYFAFTRMLASGRLDVDGDSFEVTGQAWMDRLYGGFSLNDDYRGWDWFGIQLDDQSELMVYRVRDKQGRQKDESIGTYVHPDGSTMQLTSNQIEVEPTEFWISKQTGFRYPVGWKLRLPDLQAELEIHPHLCCQELDTRGSTSQIYWEGPGIATGHMNRRAANGSVYLELSGYDAGSERNGTYSFQKERVDFVGGLINEFRLRRRGPGISVKEQRNNGRA